MSSLLVLAENVRGFERGDIVEVRANSAPYGAREAPPRFVRANIANTVMAQAAYFAQPWMTDPQFEVLAVDAATDDITVRMYSATAAASGEGGLNRPETRAFVQQWQGVVTGEQPGEITATFNVWEGFTSARHWPVGDTVQGVVFNQIDYYPETGAYTVDVDYSALGVNPTAVEEIFSKRGYEVIAHDNRVIRMGFNRNQIIGMFTAMAQRNLQLLVRVRRYRLQESAVAAAEAVGGVVEFDSIVAAEAALVDKQAV